MRHEPTEIRLAAKHPRRRRRDRTIVRRGIAAPASTPAATDVIDEAFAGMERGNSAARRTDPAACETARGDAPQRPRPISSTLATQLAAQLSALDRQREQLASLLRDVETGARAD